MNSEFMRSGDGRFEGVDMARAPMLLGEGFCADALNVRFDRGEALTRPGLVSCGWGVDRSLELPADFLLEAAAGTGDGGTAGAVDQAFSVVRTDERGFYELVFSKSGMRTAGQVGPSVGDSITGYDFILSGGANGTFTVGYAGDNVLRVTVDALTYSRIDASPETGKLKWEGTVSFAGDRGFGEVFGAVVFSDPNGREGLLLATARRARLLRDGQIPQSIPYPAGVVLDGPVRFVQAFDRVLMLRGFDAAPLVWIPQADPVGGSEGFVPIEEAGTGSTTFLQPIPNAVGGCEFNGRLYLQYGRDQIAVSEVYDYLHYDPVFQALRINEGSDDSIVRIMPFGKQRLLVFFNQSVWLLDNVFGDLSEMRGDVLTMQRGAVSADAVVQMGADVWFLSEGGVYALSQTDTAQLQSGAAALSAPIQPLIDRINWPAAGGAQAVSHEGLFYLAVPLDGATYNNALLVYDQKTTRWQGLWQSSLLDGAFLVRTDHAGRRRLVVVGGSSLADAALDGAVYVLDPDAGVDRVCGAQADIAAVVETREYTVGDLSRQRAQVADVRLAHSGARLRIVEVAGGVNASRVATGGYLEPDRSKYVVFGQAAYDVTNAADDHGAPYREDYSVPVPVVSARGWLLARITNNAADLTVTFSMLRDYTKVAYAPSFAYSGALPTVASRDVIDADGFLVDVLNRSWLVTAVGTGGTAVCAVTSAEKAAIITACNSFYDVVSGVYAMKDDAGTVRAGIRSWDFGNALSAQVVRPGSNGVDPCLMQQWVQRLRLRTGGHGWRLRIESTRGRLAVQAAVLAARATRRAYGQSV